MATFEIAYRITLAHEGGYANDPDDTGGETYMGISRNNFPAWNGWKLIDAYKARSSSFQSDLAKDKGIQDAVARFYRAEFWNRLSLEKCVHQNIANELFDTGVNCGIGIAAQILQQALNVTNRNGRDYPDLEEDRSIGPGTLSALNGHPRPNDLFKVMNVLQGAHYIQICRRNPRQEKFFRSWFSRVTL